MDRYRINRIVEFVRSIGEFPYDCDDVIERMADILTEYGIYSVFTNEEYAILMDELLGISENAEIAEAARRASIDLVADQDLRWGTKGEMEERDMTIQKMLKRRISVCFFVMLFVLTTMASGAEKPEPFNRIVIILDNSGSFTERRMEAIERTTALLDAISSRKLNRWEKPRDEITLISMDAIPEVIWRGSLAELKALAPDFWTARFESRTDYAGCTDVTGAFRVAVGHLDGDPRYVHKYLLVFSDFVHQPPVDSIHRPDRASSLPGDDFPWDGLKDVSVSAFWVPPDSKLLWQREIDRRGLGGSFAIYTTSESSEVEIKPPPKPVIELTETEMEAERQRYMAYARKLGMGAGIFVLIVIVLVAAIALGLGYSRRRRPSNSPPPTGPSGGGATQALRRRNRN